MEALGRTLNPILLADNTYIHLKDGAGVTFLCYLAAAAGDTYTLTEAKTAAGGSAAVLATITRYYTSTGDGTDAWVLHEQAAGSTAVAAASADENGLVVEVDGTELSDGFKYVKLASTGAGAVTAVLRDLTVQRDAANLPALGV